MIYLVRHGQTVLNRQGRYQGRVDSPLTELGQAQAAAVGRRLAELMVAEGGDWRIETSPQGRARQTAEIIRGVIELPALVVDERLREASYGEVESLTRPESIDRWPQLAELPSLFGLAPGGDTLEGVAERTSAWLADHADQQTRCIAVSHSAAGRMIRGLYLGLPLAEVRRLESPQDAFHRLANGRVERIEAAAFAPPEA